MAFLIGDRVTKDGAFGTIEGIFGDYAWVLPDGQTSPMTFLQSVLTFVPATPAVFEVGKTYKFPKGVDLYHIVYKISDKEFVVWVEYANGGGNSTTIALASQRGDVVEV